MALALASLFVAGGCGKPSTTDDVSAVRVLRYRYLMDPNDPLVHAVVEVQNTGPKTVRAAVLVVAGIGRNGEHRGESRTRIERLRPGEKRTISTSFTNRARLATLEVTVERASKGDGQ